jgi:5'(3')-deoxyribonucleotidase
MSLRVGVDLDGTLADLSSEFHEVEQRMFGRQVLDEPNDDDEADANAEPVAKANLKTAKRRSREQEAVWRAIRDTPDFWMQLKPIEPAAVRALQAATDQFQWEVFFITQRPRTAGASVQKQSQNWLIAQGFAVPSVLTLSGSRGKAVHALDLDFLIDDLPKNCIDVISDSKCRPILVLRKPDPHSEEAARRMNIGVVRSVEEAIGYLAQPAPEARTNTVLKILRALGLSR